MLAVDQPKVPELDENHLAAQAALPAKARGRY
jgi:hypothetical protein